jgi:DNA repair exonuclease SbcCD ATPase subunit
MSDNMVGESSASPAEAVETTDVESVGSRADEPAMSAKEFLTRRSELRNKASAEKTVEQSSQDLANQEEEASEEEGSQPQEAKDKQEDQNKEVVNNKFQKRIDKLTARYHDAERKSAEKDIQIEKLTKGVEILQKELERYASQLQLDPREERIRELEYKKEIDDFNRGLDERQENIYNESVREYQVQQRADEILEEVNSVVEEYDLVSPEEVLLAMRDKGLSAAQAARDLHQQRLQRAQKRIQGTKKHPSTVSRKGAESISPVDEPYRGAETIKKFLLQRMAERDGVAE